MRLQPGGDAFADGGMPFMDIIPTQALSMELVKKSLEKKALTNTCSEWTILGGQLSNSTFNLVVRGSLVVGFCSFKGTRLADVQVLTSLQVAFPFVVPQKRAFLRVRRMGICTKAVG